MLGGLSRWSLSPRCRRWFGWIPGARTARSLRRVDAWDAPLRVASDEELRRRSLALRYRVESGDSTADLWPEAFALVREAARRTTGLRHHDVQILGGAALREGAIAEMQTGEGKSLTASLPLYLAALAGRGAHLATANDYLAARDAAALRPILELLGLRVGVLDPGASRRERREAYSCDITYGAAREFGFDFLRDRLLKGREVDQRRDLLGRMLGEDTSRSELDPVQRDLAFCLVDEADSILLDEARTPLIVSSRPGGDSAEVAAAGYRWAAASLAGFQPEIDFVTPAESRRIELTANGRRRVRELTKPESLSRCGLLDLYEHIERALLVAREYHRDRQYVVRQGEVVIVDEFTGRLAEGRKWRDGIHQAVEAKEGLEITLATGEAARITVQDYFRLYERLAGMTGTIAGSAAEVRRIYGLHIRVIPPHRPCARQVWDPMVCGNTAAKWRAVLAEIRELHACGRPVLIGTRSIDKSEHLASLLQEAGIPHAVLNARHHATEASIVAEAGQRGRVTVATNMAGRGTDIQLEAGVAALGGLHVIGTEFHDSSRIDRQLFGRGARQGDPGSCRQFAALDDDILASAWGAESAAVWKQRGAQQERCAPHLVRVFQRAQRILERRHFRQRRLLLQQSQEHRRAQDHMGLDPYLDAGL